MRARSFLRRFQPRIVAFGALAFLVWGRPAAGAVVFHKVVDTATAAPGGDQPFSWFGIPSLDDRGNLVFWGSSGSHEGALFACRDGSLTVVADPTVPIPGRDATFRYGFRSFGASIDDGAVSFYAFTQDSELGGGVYRWENGTVSLVADVDTPIPGGTGTFNAIEDPLGFGPFSHPPIHGNAVAFRGAADTPRQRGVYTCTAGALNVVADLETPIPGGAGNFVFLSAEIAIENGAVVFRGEGENLQRGLYTDLSGSLAKVVDKNDPIPGGTGTFTSVGYPWFDRGRILFTGDGADGQQGIYLRDGGELSLVVDLNTPIPEGTGTFTDFAFNWSRPSASYGNVAFRGLGSDGQEGIYLKPAQGPPVKIIDLGDTLDGKSLTTLSMGSESLSGTTIAFEVRFGDDSHGIYLAGFAFQRGDANTDSAIDISDPVFVLGHLFADGPDPDCLDAADANDDGSIDIADAVALLGHLFGNRGPLPPPFGACGLDLNADVLGCAAYDPLE